MKARTSVQIGCADMINLSELSIYSNLASDSKRRQESDDIVQFLLSLGDIVVPNDVKFGPEPPDFIFQFADELVGVELTTLNPKVFPKGGYTNRKDFKRWQKESEKSPQPYHKFSWGEYTVRESLAAFSEQLNGKSKSSEKWKGTYISKWLLIHVGSGSPFGEVLPSEDKVLPGCEENYANYRAKVAYALHEVCQRPHPFEYIILFSGRAFLTFPAKGQNHYKLPQLCSEIVAKGAVASDEYLDWRSVLNTVKRHLTSDSTSQSSRCYERS